MLHRGPIVLALSLVACGPGAEELARLRNELDTAVAHATEADAARARGIEADLAAPSVTTTRCEASVVLNETGSPPATPVGFLAGANRGNFRTVPRAELATPGTRMTWATQLADTVRSGLEPGSTYPIDSEEALAFRRSQVVSIGDPAHDGYRYDVELVILENAPPRQLGDGTFEAGHLRGRVVVWDYADSRVVCHADATVTTGGTEVVDVGDTGGGVAANLDARLRYDALSAIGI